MASTCQNTAAVDNHSLLEHNAPGLSIGFLLRGEPSVTFVQRDALLGESFVQNADYIISFDAADTTANASLLDILSMYPVHGPHCDGGPLRPIRFCTNASLGIETQGSGDDRENRDPNRICRVRQGFAHQTKGNRQKEYQLAVAATKHGALILNLSLQYLNSEVGRGELSRFDQSRLHIFDPDQGQIVPWADMKTKPERVVSALSSLSEITGTPSWLPRWTSPMFEMTKDMFSALSHTWELAARAGHVAFIAKHPDAALPFYEIAVEMAKKDGGPTHLGFARALCDLGCAILDLGNDGDLEQARSALRLAASIAVAEEVSDKCLWNLNGDCKAGWVNRADLDAMWIPLTPYILMNLGIAEHLSGFADDAEVYLGMAECLSQKDLGQQHFMTAACSGCLATVRGKGDDALICFSKAWSLSNEMVTDLSNAARHETRAVQRRVLSSNSLACPR